MTTPTTPISPSQAGESADADPAMQGAAAATPNGANGANGSNGADDFTSRAVNPDDHNDHTLLKGETTSGGKFRPSDWCERLRGTLSILGDEEAEEAGEFVHIVNHDGKNCIMVDKELHEDFPAVYRFFINFAKDNNLVTEEFSREQWASTK